MIITVLLLAGLLAGCGDKPSNRPTNEAVTPTVTPTDVPAPNDTPTPTGTAEPTKEPTPEATSIPTTELTPTEAAPTAEPTPAEVSPTAEPTPADVTPSVGPETPTPTTEPLPTPSTTDKPTPTPTKKPTPTPTKKPTPTPTVIAFGGHMEDYIGTWYAHYSQGLETEGGNTADDPSQDYRLFIDDETLVRVHTDTHNLNDRWATWETYELRTSFSAAEKKLYESWNYGVIDYLSKPTNFATGHLVFSCTSDHNKNALFIVDAQPNGTLKTQFVYVMDNGSFPVFVDATYSTAPAYPVGYYYEDYIGVWNCQSTAAYYCEALEASDYDPFDVRLVVHEDNTLDYVMLTNKHEISKVKHFKLRVDFSDSEINTYKKWDKAGILTYDGTMEGWAAKLADDVPDAREGYLVFSCTDKDDPGTILKLRWDDYFRQLDVDVFEYDSKKNREYISFDTYKKSSPYSYKQGSYFADFLGTWNAVEIKLNESSKKQAVTDPSAMATFEICADMTAKMHFSDRDVSYKLRTKTSSSDPSWYADKDLKNVVTDYSKRRLVFVCTDKSYYPNSLIVVDFNTDGTITTKQYGKNGSNTLYIMYEKFEREDGLKRMK